MTESEKYELIEAYLEKRLSPEAQAETEALIQEDAAFAALVRKHEAAHQLLEISAIDRIVREAAMDESEAPVYPMHRPRRLLPLVAAIAGILILSFPFFYANSQYSSLSLAQSQYTAYISTGVRGSTMQDETQALLAAGNYKEAIPLLQGVPTTDPGYVAARMQLGNAFFQTRRFSDAAKAFGQVFRSGDVRFAQAAQWNAGLSELAAGNPDEASAMLQPIAANEAHAYHQKALDLLASLASPWRKLPGVN